MYVLRKRRWVWASKMSAAVVIAVACGLCVAPHAYAGTNHYDNSRMGYVCKHDYSTHYDHNLKAKPKEIQYWYPAGDFDRDNSNVKPAMIREAVSRWNDASSSLSVSKASAADSAEIRFMREKVVHNGHLMYAQTLYYSSSGNSIYPINQDYKKCYIKVCNEGVGDLSKNKKIGTLAHELGHAMGLEHRNNKAASIMCQDGYGRTAQKPSSSDVSALEHSFNY